MRKVAVLAFGLVMILCAPASGHGDLQSSSPPDGTELKKAPPRVSLTLSERPAPQAKLQVTDGCKDSVGGPVQVDGNELFAEISGGQPGKWRVQYQVISAEDGHETKGSLSFGVGGKRDCSADDPKEPDPDETGDVAAPPDDEEPEGVDLVEDDGTSPIVWVVGAGVVLAALAGLTRMRGGSR